MSNVKKLDLYLLKCRCSRHFAQSSKYFAYFIFHWTQCQFVEFNSANINSWKISLYIIHNVVTNHFFPQMNKFFDCALNHWISDKIWIQIVWYFHDKRYKHVDWIPASLRNCKRLCSLSNSKFQLNYFTPRWLSGFAHLMIYFYVCLVTASVSYTTFSSSKWSDNLSSLNSQNFSIEIENLLIWISGTAKWRCVSYVFNFLKFYHWPLENLHFFKWL